MQTSTRYLVPVLLAALGSASCSTRGETIAAPDSSDPAELIAWINTADPENDALAAIDDGDHRLIALALRSANIPGIDAKSTQKYIDRCGVKMMPGVDDIIRSEDDLRYLTLAREYTLVYNKAILGNCAPGP